MTTNQRFYISWTLMMTAAIVIISANSIFVASPGAGGTGHLHRQLRVECLSDEYLCV